MAIPWLACSHLIAVSRGHSSVLTATVQVYEFFVPRFFSSSLLLSCWRWAGTGATRVCIAFGFGLYVFIFLASIGTWSHTVKPERSPHPPLLNCLMPTMRLPVMALLLLRTKVPVTVPQYLPKSFMRPNVRKGSKRLYDFR